MGRTRTARKEPLDPNISKVVRGFVVAGMGLGEIMGASGLTRLQVRQHIDMSRGALSKEIGDIRGASHLVRIAVEEEQDLIRAGTTPLERWGSVDPQRWGAILNGVLGDPREFSQLAQRRFSREEIIGALTAHTIGLKATDEIIRLFSITEVKLALLCQLFGVDQALWAGIKRSRTALSDYSTEKRVVPKGIGYGAKTRAGTPFQGMLTMRSATEAMRAGELSREGKAWFYEAMVYPLSDGRSYLPDFWVTDVSLSEAQQQLGEWPTLKDIRTFISRHLVRIEDTKGWFAPHHPSYDKIKQFRIDFPDLPFQVLLISRRNRQWL